MPIKCKSFQEWIFRNKVMPLLSNNEEYYISSKTYSLINNLEKYLINLFHLEGVQIVYTEQQETSWQIELAFHNYYFYSEPEIPQKYIPAVKESKIFELIKKQNRIKNGD